MRSWDRSVGKHRVRNTRSVEETKVAGPYGSAPIPLRQSGAVVNSSVDNGDSA
jgi:hypothetical protein